MTYSQIFFYFIGIATVAQVSVYGWEVIKKRRPLAFGIWRTLGIRHFLVAAACAFLFKETVTALYPLHAVFRFSLLSLLTGTDANFNVMFAPAILASGSGTWSADAFVAAFLVALLFVMPLLNYEEEEMFRKGKNAWDDVPIQSAVFGMAHVFAGVPVAVCVALMLMGTVWHVAYKLRYESCLKRGLDPADAELEAVMESSAHHNAFNNIGVLILAFFLLWN